MTPNTSPEKPEWFSLIENDAPSAQVRRVDKRLTLSTAFAALAIATSGALFAGAATTSDGSAVQASASEALTSQTSTPETSALPVQGAITSAGVEKISPPSIGIADPTLNGGGQDDDDYEDDEDEDEDDYDDDEEDEDDEDDD